MTIRTANNQTAGVHTFYVASESRQGINYAVQHVRRAGQRRFFCECPDFHFRRVAAKRHCKHARMIAALVKLFHGVRRLASAIGSDTLSVAPDALRNPQLTAVPQ